MQDGGLPDVFSVKTLEEPKEKKLGEVYLFTAPYTDRKKVTRVASELKGLNEKYNFDLMGPLLFKTDLHNTWWRNVSRPGDGYHELLEQENWIYKFKGGKLTGESRDPGPAPGFENRPENADPGFLIIRSMLPEELFTGENK